MSKPHIECLVIGNYYTFARQSGHVTSGYYQGMHTVLGKLCLKVTDKPLQEKQRSFAMIEWAKIAAVAGAMSV